jgi:DNA invertase Pin-like site-specific DNA recombinase
MAQSMTVKTLRQMGSRLAICKQFKVSKSTLYKLVRPTQGVQQ